MTENIPKNAGVVIYNSQDLPLGFGNMAIQTEDVAGLVSTAIVVHNICDNGE